MTRRVRLGFFGKEFLEVEEFKGKGSRKAAGKKALELELMGCDTEVILGRRGSDPTDIHTLYARKKKLGGLW